MVAFTYRAGTAARWTLVIGPDGTVASKNTRVTPAEVAKEITAFVTRAGQT